jgi:hypothetical protein
VHHVITGRFRRIDRRRRERGQMVPIAALMALVILGGSALALDITVQTHDRRSVQNIIDSAALAGAQDLLEPNITTNTASMLQGGRQTAAATVLTTLHNSLGFPVANSNYATQAVSAGNCGNSGTFCDVDNVVFGNYTISVDSPPTTADKYGNSSYNGDSHYIEVTLRHTVRNTMGGVVGSPTGIAGGHAVAYHFGAGQVFGFALYTNTYVTDGNDNEVVQGNVYAYRQLNPSAQGHASFCAAQLSDGTQGNIVLGSPQWPNSVPSPDPAGGALQQYVISPNGADPDIVHGVSDCSQVSGGQVAQTGTDERGLSSIWNFLPHCPSSVQGVTLGSGSYMDMSYTQACVAVPSVSEPSIAGPTTGTPTSTTPTCSTPPSSGGSYSPGYYGCTGNNQSTLHIDHPLKAGIYRIAHNPNCTLPQCADVSIDQSSGNIAADSTGSAQCPTGGTFNVWLCDVTFWLDPNATFQVSNGETAVITPYVPSSPQGNDGVFPFYGSYGTSGQEVSITNTNSFLAMSGTTYLPGGTFAVGQNAFVYIDGQAIVNQWNVQSGNHPNPDIQWDSSRLASLTEILRIVE